MKLLAEIEHILRTIPAPDRLGEDYDESYIWLGRVVAALTSWDPIEAVEAKAAVSAVSINNLRSRAQGIKTLKTLLWRAQADLRFETVGPVSTAIGQGKPFEYFDEVRKIIGLARSEVWFIDPYMNADFASNYLPQIQAGVNVRLLGTNYMPQLLPAVTLLAKQQGFAVEVRSSKNLHDRFVFIDGTSCYQSGASFKDGAQKSVTTITQITDAFPELKAKYETLWNNGQQELKV